jgi:Transposase DDE domain
VGQLIGRRMRILYRVSQERNHKISKASYRVKNWREYDSALQKRGSLTVWFTPEAVAAWHPPSTGKRGRARTYSDLAIETGHLLRLAFGRPWRQTEGLLRSIASLLGLSLAIPDHTTFSRRSIDLSLSTTLLRSSEPVQVVLDSTGLKVYGAGEWQREKHGERGRRTWRKLHLAVNPDSGEILASELSTKEVGDITMTGPLLDQMAGPIASVMADGAYDGEPAYRAVAARQPSSPPAVIIPPRATAVPSAVRSTGPSLRDRHIQMIQEKGRYGWERAVGYGKRSLVETAMFRYKTLIGPTLRARKFEAQQSEAHLACSVINRMTQLGMPISQRIR